MRKMRDTYILDGKNPVECDDPDTWARWQYTADRHVAKTIIGKADISTVFLGIDHNFGDGPPLLFETMIFEDSRFEDYQTRCSTWDEAEKQHAIAVAMVEARDRM